MNSLATSSACLKLDGISLAPLIYEGESLPERTLYWKYRNNWAVRKGERQLAGKIGMDDASLYHLRDLRRGLRLQCARDGWVAER